MCHDVNEVIQNATSDRKNKQRPLVKKRKILVHFLFHKNIHTVLFWFPIYMWKQFYGLPFFEYNIFNMGNNRVILYKSVELYRLNCGQECRSEYNSSADTKKTRWTIHVPKGDVAIIFTFHGHRGKKPECIKCKKNILEELIWRFVLFLVFWWFG